MWSPKGTTLRVIRCPTFQVSQFLFPIQRSDTFLTDHVYIAFSAHENTENKHNESLDEKVKKWRFFEKLNWARLYDRMFVLIAMAK